MSKKLRQIVAIIALILMVAFLVSFTAYLIDATLLNGAIGFLALFSGVFMFSLYLVIVFDNKFGAEAMKRRAEKAMEEAKKEEEQTAENEENTPTQPQSVEQSENANN